MFPKFLIWKELLKLGKTGIVRQEINNFFRGNIIKVIGVEGWFEFLEEERTLEDIANHFNYTDLDLLSQLLNILERDRVLININGNYICDHYVKDNYRRPKIFSDAMVDIWKEYSNQLPNRLKGNKIEFFNGINLFRWDFVLSGSMYMTINKAAFLYSEFLRNPGDLLEVGCRNGVNLAHIIHLLRKQGSNIKELNLYGVDNSPEFINIANNEFLRMLKSFNHNDRIANDFKMPVFSQSDLNSFDLEDNSLSYVYCSQIFHWHNPRNMIKELIRILKPGGVLFGSQNFYPEANLYNELHIKIINGSYGFFTRDQLKSWAFDAGASKFETTTPISLFKIIK
ncbi:MAG: class I SAM-dependent methyltransferase [Candidatus Heimdallarchaeota archaeon]|nr:class I SAM-dependent methyltransferase [Candidatus Heimdallarchaeota archaeon]